MNKIEEGAVIRASWGYDQTNIDFYKVVSVKNGWAWLQLMGNVIVEEKPQYMQEMVVPDGKPVGKKFRRKIHNYGQEDFVSISDYASGSVWSGQPQLQSHTH